MKTIGTKEVNYSLHNNENYKKELEPEINHVVDKLSELFIDYFKFIIENVNDNSKLQINNNSIENLSIVSDDEKTLINIKNHELIYKENDFGILLSAIFDKSTEKIYGLCLVKEDFAEINNKISLNILDNFVNIMIYA